MSKNNTKTIFLKQLSVWQERPSQKPWARVMFIHGVGEHSERHRNTFNSFLDSGLEIIRFDLRGAGASGGRRQWVEHFEDYIEDAANVLHWIHQDLESEPLFLLGHSLGGAIATYFVSSYQKSFQGMVLSSPAYLTGQGVSKLKITVGRMLCPVLPTLRIPSLDLNGLSRDPEIAKAYKNDPLSCHFNTLQQGNEMLNAFESMPEKMEKIKIPLAIYHGTDDAVIRLEGSYELLMAASSKDKELHILPGVFHEPHNDWGKEDYFADVIRWLGKIVKSQKE